MPQTFRDTKGRLVTQLPLPDTLVDFWRLVYGNDVTIIVSLGSLNEKQKVTVNYFFNGIYRTVKSNRDRGLTVQCAPLTVSQ